jgi:NTE family protein
VAVDADDGSVHILTRESGGSLAQAVAASCSLPGFTLPITIAGRRYLDGGFASTANADLALGYDEVLVLGFRAAGPSGDRMEARLQPQLAGLRERGARVEAILPDAACLGALGGPSMDVRRRPDVTRAAIAQGRAEAVRLAAS